MIKIKRGLDLPISGAPDQVISEGPSTRSVAVIGFDYVGMKPTMLVKEGDRVTTGQAIFADKKTEGVIYTAPATGVIAAINRGEKRVLQSVVIDVEDDEFVAFDSYEAAAIAGLARDKVVDNLVRSGLWTALRTRPYSKVPALDAMPEAVFVNAMDTHPLAANPNLVIAEQAAAFKAGVAALSRLTEGKTFVCSAPGSQLDLPEAATNVEFSGPHPAGLSGTHIHYLSPVSAQKQAWSINYQDAIAVGRLFLEGKLIADRVISLAGPQVEQPRLVRTRIGADLNALVAGQLKVGDNRIVSGSVLGGRTARGAVAYLGRYHLQVSVLAEGAEREFMGWLSPGANKHSMLRIYLSQFMPSKRFAYSANTNGSERAMVPVGSYEKVMPLDILPTQLLRSLIVGDTQQAQLLGCLELDEEDLALCTYACQSKYEYGPILRENLTRIEKEG
jgi:Na+-transporting NADH:ubiquinone oxidoreductase subunit A